MTKFDLPALHTTSDQNSPKGRIQHNVQVHPRASLLVLGVTFALLGIGIILTPLVYFDQSQLIMKAAIGIQLCFLIASLRPCKCGVLAKEPDHWHQLKMVGRNFYWLLLLTSPLLVAVIIFPSIPNLQIHFVAMMMQGTVLALIGLVLLFTGLGKNSSRHKAVGHIMGPNLLSESRLDSCTDAELDGLYKTCRFIRDHENANAITKLRWNRSEALSVDQELDEH